MWGNQIKTPCYEEVDPNLLLIGIDHGRYRLRDIFRLREFARQIMSLDHLAFEGSRWTYISTFELRQNGYQTAALRNFEGQKHFLGNNAPSYVELAKKKGVSPHVFGAMRLTPLLPKFVSRASGSEIEKDVRLCLNGMPMDFMNVGQETKGEIARITRRMAIQLLPGANPRRFVSTAKQHFNCLKAGAEFKGYLARLRDREIYLPKIQELRRHVRGKLGVLLGASHVEPIKNLLAGNSEELPNWEEHVGTLSKGVQSGVHFIEEAVEQELRCR